jgi:hypothetical protein
MKDDLKRFTAEFFIGKKGEKTKLGFWDHFLANDIERAVEQMKAYLRMFDETHDYEITAIYEGWELLESREKDEE